MIPFRLSTQQRIRLLELSLGYLAPCERAAYGACRYCNMSFTTLEPWDCPDLCDGPWDEENPVLGGIRRYIDERVGKL